MSSLHNHIENHLAAALAGALSKAEQAEFDQHLASCPECQKLWKEAQMLSRLLDSTLSEKRPPPGLEDRLVRGFRTATRNAPTSALGPLLKIFTFSRGRLAEAFTVVAILALMVSIAGLPMRSARSERRSSASSKAPTALPAAPMATHPSAAAPIGAGVGGRTAARAVGDKGVKKEQDDVSSRDSPPVVTVEPAPAPSDATTAASASSLLAEAERSTQQTREQEGIQKESLALKKEAARKEERSEAPTSSPPTEPAPIVDVRKLIRNATMEFEVASYEASLEKIMKLAAEEKGFVATTNSARLPNGKVQGQVVVKVLPEKLEGLLLKLRHLGELKKQDLTTQDVTKAYWDTQSRLRNARLMEERLIKLMDDARGKITDLLIVEKELARVREQVEQMQGELKVYDSLVQFATITITLYEKDLNEAAGFLLKEQASLSIFSPSVEKTFRDARKAAEDLKAQILHSKLDRQESGQVSAVLSVLVAPEQSDLLLERFRGLGRASKLNWTNQRVAQGGTGPSDSATVKRDRVEINLAILHDDESRKQVSLVVVTRNVESSLESARSLSKEKEGEILNSSLTTTTEGRATARLVVRVAARSSATLIEAFRTLGRVSQYAVQREDQLGGNNLQDAPILVSLTLTDDEPVTQQTTLVLVARKVEAQLEQAKKLAAEMKAEVRVSNFQHTPDGREQADFVFRIPAKQHKNFIEKLEELGRVRDYSHTRQDRPSDGEKASEAPVEITMTLFSEGDLVPDDRGFFATMRKTFSEGAQALLGSIQSIGIGLAYILPWVLAFGLPIALAVLIHRRRNRLK